MKISEMIRESKKVCEKKKSFRLAADIPTFIDYENTDNVFVSHEYTGDFETLSKFSQLRKLSINQNISMDEFSRLELSKLEELYVTFDREIREITISAPELRKLTVYISNNENAQLTLFDMYPGHIDISACKKLEELTFRHCTGYELVFFDLDYVISLACVDCKYWDFSILDRLPVLSQFIATGCAISEIGFLQNQKYLTHIDLTYNEITNAEELFELRHLQEVKLYRNPITNPEYYRSLNCKQVYVTDKDHDFLGFLSSVWRCRNMAYMALGNCRQPNKKRPEHIQRIYDHQTDEEIFARYFAIHVKDAIEYHTSPEKCHRKSVLLRANELKSYIMREYPFVREYWGESMAEIKIYYKRNTVDNILLKIKTSYLYTTEEKNVLCMALQQIKRDDFLLYAVEIFKQDMFDVEIPEFEKYKSYLVKEVYEELITQVVAEFSEYEDVAFEDIRKRFSGMTIDIKLINVLDERFSKIGVKIRY